MVYGAIVIRSHYKGTGARAKNQHANSLLTARLPGTMADPSPSQMRALVMTRSCITYAGASLDYPCLASTLGREILDHINLADDPRYVAVFHHHRDILIVEHGLHGGE